MLFRFTVILLFSFFPFILSGQVETLDSTNILNQVVIFGEKSDFLSLQNGEIKLDMKMMDMMPNILGNADPLHYLRFLPGIQMNNEYDAGLHIQGCDNGHNMVSVDGIPIYNPGHLLGIFSTFNTSHYKYVQINTHPFSSKSPNRLGGDVDMKLCDELPRKANGIFSVGPISSQGTARIPLSDNSAVFLSGRVSYLNMFYSRWLDIDGSKVKYNFGDLNVTYLHKINKKSTLWIDGYYGGDRVHVDDSFYEIDLSMEWDNKMISAHLKTEINEYLKFHQKIFVSNYENRMFFKSDYFTLRIPSGITTYGYMADVKYKRMKMGVNACHHNIELQSPSVSNFYQDTSIKDKQQSQEISAYAECSKSWKSFLFEMGIRGSCFHGNDITQLLADPSASIIFEPKENWNIALTGYQRHQFLSQTGITSMGLPSEFWISSTKACPPQMIRGLSLKWQFFYGNRYSLFLEGFYKKLYNQIEYIGDLLDFKDTRYELNNFLFPSKGENYGLSINLSKRTGKIVGWVNYTYTHARRSADHPILGDNYSPSHERPHELDIVTTYKHSNKLHFGATLVYASGTAFTAPTAFYYNNGNIVSQFSDYNANRLPGYLRLDLSTNFYFKNMENKTSGVNFSLYNALNVGNPLLYRLKIYDNEYEYQRLTFVMKIMPSISFFYKF